MKGMLGGAADRALRLVHPVTPHDSTYAKMLQPSSVFFLCWEVANLPKAPSAVFMKTMQPRTWCREAAQRQACVNSGCKRNRKRELDWLCQNGATQSVHSRWETDPVAGPLIDTSTGNAHHRFDSATEIKCHECRLCLMEIVHLAKPESIGKIVCPIGLKSIRRSAVATDF